jgi:DNA-binding NarL/FixJ family response regulator
MLQLGPELRVVGEASDGLEIVHLAEELKPRLDSARHRAFLNLKGMEAANRLSRGAKILFLTQNNEAKLVRATLSNGAQHVLKVDAGSELLPAIKAVLQGEKVVSSGIKRRKGTTMLSPEEIAQIKAEIERLERLREECLDSGIRKRIEAWIEAEKKKLASSDNPK